MRRLAHASYLVLLCLIASACIQHDQAKFYISGTVIDATTGLPIPNVSVSANALLYSPIQTDGNGGYSIENTLVSSEPITISAWKRGYRTYSANLGVLDGKSELTHNIELIPGDPNDKQAPPPPLVEYLGSSRLSWRTMLPVPDDLSAYLVYHGSEEPQLAGGIENGSTAATEQGCYTVTAIDYSDNESLPSGQACKASLACGEDAANVPALEYVRAVSATEVQIGWMNRGVGLYHVYRDGILVNALNDASWYDDYGLSPNTKYCYKITMVKDTGESQPCEEMCITTWPL